MQNRNLIILIVAIILVGLLLISGMSNFETKSGDDNPITNTIENNQNPDNNNINQFDENIGTDEPEEESFSQNENPTSSNSNST